MRKVQVVANADTPAPDELDEALIRRAFRGTIYPPTRIWVEPLEERGDWWAQVLADIGDVPPEWLDASLLNWRNTMKWFHAQSELRAPAFVMIGEDPLEECTAEPWNGGCVFPRLALALTRAGSLIGICNHVIHA